MGPAEKVPFHCPAAGTKTQRRNAAGSQTTTWNGAAPDDPVLCAATANNGKQIRSLYGFYSLPVGGDEADVRAALAAVFGGATSQKWFQTVEVPLNVSGISERYLYEHCWSQVGTTTIPVDGKPTKVVSFAVSDEGKAGNYFAADWVYYYDPATGVIVQGDVSMRRGNPMLSFKRKIVPS